ncbi:hypothetical protein [Chryseobacterium lathyri]|uniref:hypothetical protein n=1 Tax=Chryseobacterium lathyri TaxID=395933 RepID=UPI00277FEDF8|nr:hypothetical protein [Chryseobacterium lathyri]MDQ0066072.1 hypothetical protein [Chryseobacterium lathyri]
MNNELLYPFKNLEIYLKTIDANLNSFYNSFKLDAFARRIVPNGIDKENMQVSMLKDYYKDDENPVQIFTFSEEAGNMILNLLTKGFANVDKALELQRKLSKNRVLVYLDTLNTQLTEVFTKDLIDKYTFLEQYRTMAFQNIEELVFQEKEQFPSFPPLNFIVREGENVISKLETLYSLLISYSLISCTKEDFIKAFTGHKIDKGINWIAKSPKNNTTNKPLLVYFFRQLMNNRYIKASFRNDENHYLTTLFRNRDGSEFTSRQLSSAKYDMSDNKSAQQELIDDIISQL